MEKAVKIIESLIDKQIYLSVEANQNLKITGAKAQLTEDLISVLKEHKTELVQYLLEQKELLTYSPKKIADRPEDLPLSYAQGRLWFIDQSYGSSHYHMPQILKINGTLEASDLEAAFNLIINRHEVLRTVFYEKSGVGYQKMLTSNQWQLHVSEKNKEEELKELIKNYVELPFDLSCDHPIRANLTKINDKENLLIIVTHHIAADGWSNAIIVNELFEAYQAINKHRIPNLSELSIQYVDYALWEQKQLQGPKQNNQLNYWKKQLTDVEPLQLPLDFKRPTIQSHRGANLSFICEKQLSEQLQALSKKEGVTLFMLLLTIYKVLLFRYSGQTDLCVGTTVANRPYKELEPLVGFFVNALAIRTDLSQNPKLNSLLAQVKDTTLAAFENIAVPFEKVVDLVSNERNPSRSPIFQVLFVLDNNEESHAYSIDGGLNFEFESFDYEIAKFDLTFFAKVTPSGIGFSINYCTDLFKPETIELMKLHYKRLLLSAVENIDRPIGALKMLSPCEEYRLINGFAPPKSISTENKTILGLFLEQVQKYPESIALKFEELEMSYAELDEKSSKVAQYLKNTYNINGSAYIGILMEPSEWFLIAMLGTLKVGASYVPIDPGLPNERLEFIVRDADLQCIFIESASLFEVLSLNVPICSLDIQFTEIEESYDQNSIHINRPPESHSYVIYTSGTTGKPKGVMVSDQNLLDYYLGLKSYIDLDDIHSFGWMSTPSADLGNTVLFGSLFSGGTLHLFRKSSLMDAAYLHNYFGKNQVDCIKIVPNHWDALDLMNDPLMPVKVIIFGGDVLKPNLLERIKKTNKPIQVINHYGPTETTIGKLMHSVDLDKNYNRVPIGNVFSNNKVYVVNDSMKLCPFRVSGELLIGGEGVSKGYLNNEPLTREKFIKNPIEDTPSIVYRTGDLVLRRPDGELEFLGRIDNQAKIRGYRVELNEISSLLDQCQGVLQNFVMVRPDAKGNNELAVFIKSEEGCEKERVLSYIQNALPAYMVPNDLIEVDEFPLTANGKIDRKALKKLGRTDSDTKDYVPPSDSIESSLAEIWEELLGINQIGVQENFFELGGHSLLAIRVLSAIKNKFNAELSITDLFEHVTIADLAKLVKTTKTSPALPKITNQERPNNIPLSFAQERLWFIDQLRGSSHYHLPSVLRIQGKLDVQLIEKSLRKIIDRHQILRTTYYEENGNAYQRVQDAKNWRLTLHQEFIKDAIEEKKMVKDLVLQTFDLENDYLFRAHLIPLKESEHLLVLVRHHIASDGWSVSLITKEFVEIYRSDIESRPPNLPDMDIQYIDYALWQRAYLNSVDLEAQLNYWDQQLKGLSPSALPTDFTRPPIQSIRGRSIDFSLDAEKVNRLRKIAEEQEVTIFMLLLTVYKVLLYRYSNQTDICVGTTVANRPQAELENLVGFFVNALALRSDLDENPRFSNLLKAVKSTTLNAYNHVSVPFAKVVDRVEKQRDKSRSSLFQVLFVLNNNPDPPAIKFSEGINVNIESVDYEIAKFDLTLFAKLTDNEIHCSLNYCSDLFLPETIQQMRDHFLELVDSILLNIDQNIDQLRLISIVEEKQILDKFGQQLVLFPTEKSVIDLFEEQVKNHPNELALVYRNRSLTFEELDKKATYLGCYLQSEYNLNQDDLVGIMMENSDLYLVAILGILKAGAGYVPIETGLPKEKQTYVIENSKIKALIIESSSLFDVLDLNLPIFSIDLQLETINPEPKLLDKAYDRKSSDLAYVIYTSGTTGFPKGVKITNRNIVDYVYGLKQAVDLENCHSFGLMSTLSADLGNTILFGSLLTGGCIHLFDKPSLMDAAFLHQYFNENKIDCIKIVPSHWGALEYSEELLLPVKLIIFGGDVLSPQVVERIHESDPLIQVINHYGPTETTIGKLLHKVSRNKDYTNIPIGRLFSNAKAYVVNTSLQLCPIGVPGELIIGGEGVAAGYLNEDELTKKNFIKDPFSKEGRIVYRTGDLVKWLPTGEIEFLGRIDDQVKIRGYRVELTELNTLFNQIELVEQAYVTAFGDPDRKKLVAYVVPRIGFNKSSVMDLLKSTVPDYKVPSIILELEELPLTSNGKVDRKALPYPDESLLTEKTYQEPRNEIEEDLCQIWSTLLRLEKVGIEDNFFELGGDSIIIIQVVSQAKRKGYQLQVQDLFDYQDIASLAEIILENRSITHKAEQGILEGEVALSPIQHWFFSEETESMNHFNQSILVKVDKKVAVETLSSVVKLLQERHDALRFVYKKEVDGIYKGEAKWKQSFDSRIQKLELEDLTHTELNKQAGAIEELCQKYQATLNIENGNLAKFVFMQTPESDNYNRLFIVVHHLAIDTVSWRIIMNEMEHAVKSIGSGDSFNFGPKTSSYRDWMNALLEYTHSEKTEHQLNFWESTIKEFKPLPSKENVSKALRKDTEKVQLTLDQTLTETLLKKTNSAYHTEINDLLIAALVQTLCDWLKRDSIVIGMEGHGREKISPVIDTTETVGWFTSKYPSLLQMEEASGGQIGNLIKSVKEQLRKTPDKGLGFGCLKYLHTSKEVRKVLNHQAWDIVFNYLGQFDQSISDIGLLPHSNENQGERISPNYPFREKLIVNGAIWKHQLHITWTYSKHEFDKSTIEYLANNFISNLKSIIDHCSSIYISVWTPSDFGLNEKISFQELDSLITENQLETDKITAIYELSPLQEGILFHTLLDDESTTYITQYEMKFPEGINVDAFIQAWNLIIQRHTVLRTAFLYDKSSLPLQYVRKNVPIPIEVLDHSHLNSMQQEKEWLKLLGSDKKKGFNMNQAPLTRITLIKVGPIAYKMIWTKHHILWDGWSGQIIMGEVLDAYHNYVNNLEPQLFEEDQYQDYIQYLNSISEDREKTFWQEYLNAFEQPTLLPFSKSKTDRNKGIGDYAQISLRLSENWSEQINNYAREQKITVNNLVQSIWAFLLSNYSGKEDVAFGITVSGRPSEENYHNKVGLYINTIPIRLNCNKELPIDDWLKNTQTQHAQILEYQFSAQKNIQHWGNINGDFFDSILVFYNYPLSEAAEKKTDKLKIEDVKVAVNTNYLLTIEASIREDFVVEFKWNESLLDRGYVEMIKGHFQEVLSQLIEESPSHLHEISLLTAHERNALLQGFNGTKTDYKTNLNIIQLFEEQVGLSSEKTAIVFNDKALSFAEVDAISNQIAHYLITQYKVESNDLIGVQLQRSDWLLLTILGILKSGAAYVPIEPTYPQERIDYIINDINCKVCLDEQALQKFKSNQHLFPTNSCRVKIELEQFSYAIYTSGSTGKPKGVLNYHKGLSNRLLWMKEELALHSGDIFLQKTPFTFDVSVWELLLPMVTGATLVIAKPEGHKDPAYLQDLIAKQAISIVHFVPSMLNMFLIELDPKSCKSLRHVVCSGEALSVNTVQQFKNELDWCSIHNYYGPTEASIDVTSIDLTNRDVLKQGVPIGKPVPNTSIYIVNEKMDPQPIGVPGELLIGGIQVAKGYLNRTELSQEKFIKNPFAEGMVYRTGDLAKWLPDGNIHYIGRLDHQVKIRGNRIELGEIEVGLNSFSLIDQSVVITRKDSDGQPQLVAYMVTKQELHQDLIRTFLKTKLPEYMIPSIFVTLEEIPLTKNGKVDRKSLPEPQRSNLSANTFLLAGNDLERQITSIWEEVLGIDRIGAVDNFFELGGHSLMIIRAVALMKKRLEANISLKDFYTHPTIKSFARLIQGRGKTGVSILNKAPKLEAYPLTPMQEVYWLACQNEHLSAAYNITSIWRISGNMDVEKFQLAFKKLLDRHEILRSVINYNTEGELKFFIKPVDQFINALTISHHENASMSNEEAIQLFNDERRVVFNFERGPLINLKLIRNAQSEWYLLFNTHHIIVDAISIQVIFKELLLLYNNLVGEPKNLKTNKYSFFDYSYQYFQNAEKSYLDQNEKFWSQYLKNRQPKVNFPNANTGRQGGTEAGSCILDIEDLPLLRAVSQFNKEQGSTLFITLLTFVKFLIVQETNQTDISFGNPVSTRTEEDLFDMVGLFLNTIILRSKFEKDPTFMEAFKTVKTSTMAALGHSEYPYLKIVRTEKEINEHEGGIFNIGFNLNPAREDFEETYHELGMEVHPLRKTEYSIKADMWFDINEFNNRLSIRIAYNKEVFERGYINSLLLKLERIINYCLENSNLRMSELSHKLQKDQEKLKMEKMQKLQSNNLAKLKLRNEV